MNPGTINLDALSDDAKAIAGCWFARMRPNSASALTLELRALKPAPRTQVALDELVANGVVTVQPLNAARGLIYKPIVNCFPAFEWFMQNAKRPDLSFRLMIPIEAEA